VLFAGITSWTSVSTCDTLGLYVTASTHLPMFELSELLISTKCTARARLQFPRPVPNVVRACANEILCAVVVGSQRYLCLGFLLGAFWGRKTSACRTSVSPPDLLQGAAALWPRGVGK
jgi:hypothetical protein